jgi:site-specific DNA recombinase
MTKVGIYCRISQEKGDNDRSIDDQRLLGIEYCKENSFSYEVYIDEGISGTIDERPSFKKLLSDIIEGEINIVWVFDDSRIQRNPEIRYLFNNTLLENNVDYYTHIAGRVDLTNPETNLLGGIMAEFNQYFVTITKIKIQSVLRRRALRGKGWGIPPYGFNYDNDGYYVLNEDEAEIVKVIYALSLSGWGTERIARKLNDDKIPTRYNQYDGIIKLHKKSKNRTAKIIKKKDVRWVGNTVRGIIKNPMFYGKKIIGEITIDIQNPLFSLEYWEEVNYNLSNKNRNTINTGGKKKYNYLLNNVVKCGRCNRNYNGKTRQNKNDHFYYCMSKRYRGQNCGNRSINIDKIEKFVWNLMFEPRTLKLIKDEVGNVKQKKQYENELIESDKAIEQLKKERSNILDIVGKGLIPFDEVKEKIDEIRASLNDTQRRKTDALERIKNISSNDFSDIEKGSDFFENMEFEKRKNLVEKFIKSIEINWVDEIFNSKKIRYYILVIEFTMTSKKRVFTNHLKMNLDMWLEYGINYSGKNNTPSFGFYASEMIEGKWYSLQTIERWKEYLGDRFDSHSDELSHKLTSTTAKKYLNTVFDVQIN